MEGPLLEELNNGIAQFVSEINEFDADYIAKGPLIKGISAKEASDRV